MMDNHKKKCNKTHFPSNPVAGYTLVELIVSLGLFTIVVFIGISSLLVVAADTRHARATQKLVNNVSFALDDITESARVGSGHWCGSNASDDSRQAGCVNGKYFGFKALNRDDVVYRLRNGRIEKSSNDGQVYAPITGDDITVEEFRVSANGVAVQDGVQGHARILVEATIYEDSRDEDRIRLQSFVTQRGTDF